jgi:thiol-disulfide isomerase/thioredoxin
MSDERASDGPDVAKREPDPDRETNPWILRAVALCGVAVLAFLVLRPASDDGEFPVPQFSLDHLSGDGSVSSDDLKGKVAVINFWASWCGPCRREAPLLDKVSSQYSEDELLVIGVVVQDTPEEAQAFVRRFGLTYTIADGLDQELYRALRKSASAREGLPQTYFIGPDGQVSLVGDGAPVLGEIEESELRAAIEALGVDAR